MAWGIGMARRAGHLNRCGGLTTVASMMTGWTITPTIGCSVVSDTTVATMVRSWKRARLNAGEGALGYPKVNILAKWGMASSKRPAPTPEGELTDADIIQRIVNGMPSGEKSAFEAYHLMLIRGQRCRELPHKARALVLGIDESTYHRRVKRGWRYIRNELDFFL